MAGDLAKKIDVNVAAKGGGVNGQADAIRLAIARALVNDPPLLLADEPTGNLDTVSTAEILSIFRQLNRDGITVIIVTHEMDIAAQTQRIIRLLDGKVISDEKVA